MLIGHVGNCGEENYDPGNGISVRDGPFDVPTGPGLGIALAEDRSGERFAPCG